MNSNFLYKHRRIIVVIELIILLSLGVLMAYRIKNPEELVVDLADMKTDYDDAMSYDGEKWTFDKEYEATYWGYDYLLYGPKAKLKSGTYTIEVDYTASDTQTIVLESKKIEVGPELIYLSRNKNNVKYDFTLDSDINDFQIRLQHFYGGDFSLKGLKIIRNTHDIRCFAFVLLLFFIFINVLIYYPKARSKAIFVLVGISILVSLPLFVNGYITGHDKYFHLMRIEAIALGLKSGEFPVKMYQCFNDGYGYPVGVYYGDAFLYIPAVLRLVGFTTSQSYRMLLFVINCLVVFSAYICGKCIFKKEKLAIIFSFVYSTASYRLVGIYTRGAIGESLAYVFYPIIMLAMWNIYTQDIKAKTYKNNAIVLALGVTGIIYSHILSTEMTVIVLFLLAIVLFRKTIRKETIIVLLKSIVYCALMSVAFLIPFLEYYTKLDVLLDSEEFKSVYIQNKGVYIAELFSFFKDVSGGGEGMNPSSRMQLTPGLLLMSGLLMGLYLIMVKKANKRVFGFLGGGIACLYLASNLFPWNAIYQIPVLGPVLVSVQFPFRYLAIAICFLSILFILVLEAVISEEILGEKKAIEYIVVLGLISTFVFIGHYEKDNELIRTYDTADLLWCTDTSVFGLGAKEYLLKDSDVTSTAFDYAVYGDNIKATIQSEKGLKMEIWVDAKANSTLEVPRFAYPHMVAFTKNGEKLKFFKGNNNKLTVRFDKDYEGDVIVDFIEPWYWRMAEVISLISIISIGASLYYKKRKS